jgi:hypothetical protein
MKKSAIIFLIFFTTTLGFSQSSLYKAIGKGVHWPVNNFVVDSITNKIFLDGWFLKAGFGSNEINAKGLVVWNENHWDSIHHMLDSSTSFKKIGNDLYCTGRKLRKLNRITGNWDVIARFGSGYCETVCKYQNKLAIFGNFDSINGTPCKGMARYDGVSFTQIGNITVGAGFVDAIEYQGKLYIGGNIFESTGLFRGIGVWDGSNWAAVGNYWQGLTAGVNRFYIYKNKLIVAGVFCYANNAPGNAIFSYDGVSFNNLSDGFNSVYETALDMFEYHGNLIITGMHNNDTYLPNSNVLCPAWISFDGNDFCSYVNFMDVGSGFLKGGVYNDTLIFATQKILGLDTVNFFAKYMGNMTPLFCSNVVGIKENIEIDNGISIYPNPFTDKLTVDCGKLNSNEIKKLALINVLGQKVFEAEFYQNNATIDILNVSEGTYITELSLNSKILTRKKFIKK